MVAQVVVGVGNPIMCDDGLGRHAVERLPPDVPAEVCFAGTTAFLALEAMSGMDRAVVVDAINVPGADPGSIHRYPLSSARNREPPDGAGPDPEPPEVLMHDFSFGDALEIGELAYELPEEIVLLGLVPERVEAGDALSEVVERALPTLVERVLAELDRPLPQPIA
jgi:hydrogenase maturation protease